MALYEHIYLARQDVTAQQVEAMTEQFKSVIEAGGGKFAKVEYWGVKTLAYRIKKNRKAHFTLINIDAPASAVAEMERQAIYATLDHCKGNKRRCAEILGVSLKTLYNRLSAYQSTDSRPAVS